MVKIEYTDKKVCGEPGPNLYWYGNKEDFFWLSCILQPLGKLKNYKISFPCKKGNKNSTIVLISKEKGFILNKYDAKNNKIIIELDNKIWQEILLKIYLLSMTPGREYIDLETYKNIYEEANFIIDSQF